MLIDFNELSKLPVGSVIRDDDGVFQIGISKDTGEKIILTPGSDTAFMLNSVKYPAEILFIPFD